MFGVAQVDHLKYCLVYAKESQKPSWLTDRLLSSREAGAEGAVLGTELAGGAEDKGGLGTGDGAGMGACIFSFTEGFSFSWSNTLGCRKR